MLRHHISACFAALQRKLLDLLHDALPGLRAGARGAAPAAPKPFPGAPQSSPAIEVGCHQQQFQHPPLRGLSAGFRCLSSKCVKHVSGRSLLADVT